MFEKILVGTDGFGPASRAVERAVELGKSSGAEVIVVHAYSEEAGDPIGGGPIASRITAAEGLLSDVEKHYAGGGVKMRTLARSGAPAEVLVDVAEDEAVDLLVVGNKGMHQRFALGSVPNRVSHHAPCSVLIVHTVED
ncbi:MAG TPA: universal stress protein [Actinomycetota bacterium]|nr:universal stress protein [Actinomycetota bacterium]